MRLASQRALFDDKTRLFNAIVRSLGERPDATGVLKELRKYIEKIFEPDQAACEDAREEIDRAIKISTHELRLIQPGDLDWSIPSPKSAF
jgi:hypothetical protein